MKKNDGSVNEFKSIHIDLEKGIFKLNGEPMKKVVDLKLYAKDCEWDLHLTRDEVYASSIRKGV